MRHAANAGRFIGPVFALDDGRVLAHIRYPYDDTAHWVELQEPAAHPCLHCAAWAARPTGAALRKSDGQHITTHDGLLAP